MLGSLTYSIAALASLATCVLLLVKRRDGDVARRVAVACGIGAFWALVLAGQAMMGGRLGWVTLIVQGLRYAAWLVVLRALAPIESPRWLKRAGLGLCALVVLYASCGWIGDRFQAFSLPLDKVLGYAGLLLAFAGLVATEQAMRNAPTAISRDLRLCAAGIGGQFAYDLFLYSQAQLLGALDGGAWALRGVVVGVLLVPLTIGVWRLPATAVRVFVSRHVVFYTSAFVAVGLYLCLMAIGGFYVREHGGSWGNALQVVFLCGAVAILVSLLLSESPLRRLRVFIATHFYRNKYDYRVEWLRFVQTLSSVEEPDIRRTAIRAVAQIFGSAGGLLVLRDDDTGAFTLQASWPETPTSAPETAALPPDDALPAFLQQRQWVIDLQEYSSHPERYGNLRLPRWLSPSGPWRVIAPLLIGNRLLGFLVLRSPPGPFTMTFEDRDLLKTVGRNVAVQLAQHQADVKLSESRQFDAYNRFAAFVMHDLKNSVAQLQLLVANAARHRHNPVFVDDAIGTIQNTAERMTRLIEQLQSRDVQGTARVIDLAAIAQSAVGRSQSRQPSVSLTSTPAELYVRADPDRLGSVIDHVIRNAQDATPAAGTVALALRTVGEQAHLHVIDAGAGMDDEFVRERLFRPFDSTKGSKGMGIGAYQVREYVRSLGGDIEVQSTPGKGTDFCIRLNLCPKKNQDS
jgi:putative PEP-CTERM system histidine kinase